MKNLLIVCVLLRISWGLKTINFPLVSKKANAFAALIIMRCANTSFSMDATDSMAIGLLPTLTAKVKEDTHAHDPIPFAWRHL